eukprot:4223201-Pyramimonas_sp.AAC.1
MRHQHHPGGGVVLCARALLLAAPARDAAHDHGGGRALRGGAPVHHTDVRHRGGVADVLRHLRRLTKESVFRSEHDSQITSSISHFPVDF